MNKHEILNADGSLRAVIYTQPSGRQEIHSASGSFLGVYDPAIDETRTASGSLVGRGILLATLI